MHITHGAFCLVNPCNPPLWQGLLFGIISDGGIRINIKLRRIRICLFLPPVKFLITNVLITRT